MNSWLATTDTERHVQNIEIKKPTETGAATVRTHSFPVNLEADSPASTHVPSTPGSWFLRSLSQKGPKADHKDDEART